MNPTLLKAAATAVLVAVLLAYSIARLAYSRTVSSWLQLAGTMCLVIVVLAHVAEATHTFPRMRWGAPDSPGHYLDLASAILGVTLFLVAILLRVTPFERP